MVILGQSKGMPNPTDTLGQKPVPTLGIHEEQGNNKLISSSWSSSNIQPFVETWTSSQMLGLGILHVSINLFSIKLKTPTETAKAFINNKWQPLYHVASGSAEKLH